MKTGGAPEACVSVDGERAGDGACGRVADLYGGAVGDFAGDGVSRAEHSFGALGLSARDGLAAGRGLRAVYEEVLPSA